MFSNFHETLTFAEVVESINKSPHKGLYGLVPEEIDSSVQGEFTLELLRRKFAPTDHLLSKEEQEKLKQEFFSKPNNRLLKVGRYCLASVNFSTKFIKGYMPKAGLVCVIKAIDFTQRPVLFELETAFDHKTLPIKVRICIHVKPSYTSRPRFNKLGYC